MRQRKYTLPRHTNLASQGSRLGAFLIDVAVMFAITIPLFLFVFGNIFDSKVSPITESIHNEQLNSHLRYMKDGKITQIDKDAPYEEYRDRISYFYLNFLTGENIEEGFEPAQNYQDKIKNESGVEVEKKDYYTISWFNKNVFEIQTNDPDKESKCLFTYLKNEDGTPKLDQLAVPKEETLVPKTDIVRFMQIKYLDAYDVLLNQDYILKLTNESNFLYSLEFALGAFIGMAITYLMFPFIFKNGQTLGKKAFGLGLANSDGYILNNNQLFMRIMPLFVCNAALLIPMWPNLLVMMLVYLTVFLVSFALAMASPKKASLHDFSARTIVINLKTSTLFKDEFEEEAYLLKEDDITPEPSEGEEPELKYEK